MCIRDSLSGGLSTHPAKHHPSNSTGGLSGGCWQQRLREVHFVQGPQRTDPPLYHGAMEGSVRVEGLDTWESDVGVLAQKVGYVYQDFENQIVRLTVLDDASYACLNYAFPDYLDRGRAALAQLNS